jgi:pimeloyl-ACP methyl ester carboxylesterase
VAFQLLLDHPELVRSAVIVNSGPSLPLGKAALWRRLILIRLLGLQRFGRILSERLLPGPALAPERARFLEGFKDNRLGPYLAALKALARWDARDRLGEIRLPVLVVAADQDYTPVSFKQAYVDRLADARLVVIPDSRHALPAERPAAFNSAVLEFLAQRA